MRSVLPTHDIHIHRYSISIETALPGQTMHTKPSYNVVFIAPAVKALDKRLLCCGDLLMANSVIVCVCAGVGHLRQRAGDGF